MIRLMDELLLLVLFAVCPVVYGQFSDGTALADEFLRYATEEDDLFPVDLIYPGSLNDLPSDQKYFMMQKPVITIFDQKDFGYRIVEKSPDIASYLTYCKRPTHELVIFHKKWNPEHAALTVDLIDTKNGWFILVPKIEEGLFREIKTSFRVVLAEYESAKEKLSADRAIFWKEMLQTEEKYTAIDEVSDAYLIGLDASLLLLSYIVANY